MIGLASGGVRVMAERCRTCIFRPGNLMHLEPGRVADMVATCRSYAVTHGVVCHETLGVGDDDAGHSNVLAPEGQQAVCRGYADAYDPTILQLARRIWRVIEIEPAGELQ